MRLSVPFLALFFGFAINAQAHWQKINDVDYTFGPFKIYNITLFTETGEYTDPQQRPLMLTLEYDKPVDGRDFAISLAKSWNNLGINLPDQNAIITHLRKTFPRIEPRDKLSYIALADRGYFVLNDTVLNEEFPSEVNQAILDVWLNPRVEIGKKITVKKANEAQVSETVTIPLQNNEAESEATKAAPLSDAKPEPEADAYLPDADNVIPLPNLGEETANDVPKEDAKAENVETNSEPASPQATETVPSNEKIDWIDEDNPPPIYDAPIEHLPKEC